MLTWYGRLIHPCKKYKLAWGHQYFSDSEESYVYPKLFVFRICLCSHRILVSVITLGIQKILTYKYINNILHVFRLSYINCFNAINDYLVFNFYTQYVEYYAFIFSYCCLTVFTSCLKFIYVHMPKFSPACPLFYLYRWSIIHVYHFHLLADLWSMSLRNDPGVIAELCCNVLQFILMLYGVVKTLQWLVLGHFFLNRWFRILCHIYCQKSH